MFRSEVGTLRLFDLFYYNITAGGDGVMGVGRKGPNGNKERIFSFPIQCHPFPFTLFSSFSNEPCFYTTLRSYVICRRERQKATLDGFPLRLNGVKQTAGFGVPANPGICTLCM